MVWLLWTFDIFKFWCCFLCKGLLLRISREWLLYFPRLLSYIIHCLPSTRDGYFNLLNVLLLYFCLVFCKECYIEMLLVLRGHTMSLYIMARVIINIKVHFWLGLSYRWYPSYPCRSARSLFNCSTLAPTWSRCICHCQRESTNCFAPCLWNRSLVFSCDLLISS